MYKRRIYFRADASSEIGYGHFIRTLALADMLKDDFDCTFFTQSPTIFQQKEVDKVCRLVSLPADDSHFNLFLEILCGNEIVVLDNYFFTTKYQQEIKNKGCKLVCIDDMHNKHFVADAVINHSLGINEKDYSKETYTQLYLGLDYALLRKPFIESLPQYISNKKNNDKYKVIVSFGGADKYGIADHISSELACIEYIEEIYLVSPQKIAEFSNRKVTYLSHLSAEQMKNLFLLCNLAIIPSSTIMKEAIACGIDILGGYFVDNQVNSYNQFCKINAIKGFGDLSKKENRNNLIQFIKEGFVKELSLNKNIISSSIVDKYIMLFKQLC